MDHRADHPLHRVPLDDLWVLPFFGVNIAMDLESFVFLFILIILALFCDIDLIEVRILRRLVPGFHEDLSRIVAILIWLGLIFYLLLAADWVNGIPSPVALLPSAGAGLLIMGLILVILVANVIAIIKNPSSAVEWLPAHMADVLAVIAGVGIGISMTLTSLSNVLPQGWISKDIENQVISYVGLPSILYLCFYFGALPYLSPWLDKVTLMLDERHYALNMFIAALVLFLLFVFVLYLGLSLGR